MNHIHKSNALIKLALHFHRSRRKKESAWKFPKLPGSTFRRFFLFFFFWAFFSLFGDWPGMEYPLLVFYFLCSACFACFACLPVCLYLTINLCTLYCVIPTGLILDL